MRNALAAGILLLAGLALASCKREESFDERYAAAQRRLDEKSAGIDRELAAASSDAAAADAAASRVASSEK